MILPDAVGLSPLAMTWPISRGRLASAKASLRDLEISVPRETPLSLFFVQDAPPNAFETPRCISELLKSHYFHVPGQLESHLTGFYVFR